MTLRIEILRSALPFIPTHSFTRPALSLGLRSIKPEISDPDAVIDTLFSGGSVGCSKALVENWKGEGCADMSGAEVRGEKVQEGENGNGNGNVAPRGVVSIDDALKRRLEYSARVGEHLVEAYAQLAAPSSTPSIPIPIPAIPKSVLSSLSNLRFPQSYTPPSSSSSSSSNTASSPSSSSILSSLAQFASQPHRIPLLSVHPLGPMSYAWEIADQALYLSNPPTAGSVLKKGYWNEPVGAGPEWYAHRIGLTLAYLSAESHLLQPYPHPSPSPSTSTSLHSTGKSTGTDAEHNPHLATALSVLTRNLKRYRQFIASSEKTENGLGEVMGFVEFVGKSWQGLIKSRYW